MSKASKRAPGSTKSRSASKLSRRAFLFGAAGTAVALPLMEYMLDSKGTAYADGSALPKRFVNFFVPTAILSSSANSLSDNMTPKATGTGYDLPMVLQPIGQKNLKSYVTVVSNLFVPPFRAPGGYDDDYHEYSVRSTFTGVSHGWVGETWKVHGLSVDQVIANAIGSQTKFPSLVYQIDPARSKYGGISFKKQGNEHWWVEPQTSPTAAYRSLFTNFTAPGGGGGGTPDDIEQRLRVSSLSYVRDQLNSLRGKLGSRDKARLDQHLTQVRALEQRLAQVSQPPPPTTSSFCKKISFPASDPAKLGGVHDIDKRAALFAELVQVALACDMTRSVSIAMSDKLTGSGMVHKQWAGIGGLHSDVQHNGTNAQLDRANQLFVGMYADLVSKLRDVKEGTGTLLDNAAVTFSMEGGKGGRAADGGGDPNHSTDNMLMLVAGKAGGLKSGQHLRAPKDTHPCRVFNTVMKAIGVNKTMGEVSGTVPGLT